MKLFSTFLFVFVNFGAGFRFKPVLTVLTFVDDVEGRMVRFVVSEGKADDTVEVEGPLGKKYII